MVEDQMSKKMSCALVIVLLIAAATPLHAVEKTAITAPSVKNGDPPPGNALALSIPQARAMLQEAIKKRYVGTMEFCNRALLTKVCLTYVLSEATDFRPGITGFYLATPYTFKAPPLSEMRKDGNVSVSFKKVEKYIQAYRFDLSVPGLHLKIPNQLYEIGFLPNPESSPMAWPGLSWPDETVAQEFADAFNRLVYAAYHEDFATFSAAAKAWRENPVKPPLSPEADRHRILAENAIKEKNLDSAIEHYESALDVQPTWPAGWFNLALIYAGQNDYSNAVGCMNHYLELVPDAPDAKDAREQMIIWEDKARH
jgi:tetratricopeptide (TPR) repeat protein